jgi:hypothetical protein
VFSSNIFSAPTKNICHKCHVCHAPQILDGVTDVTDVTHKSGRSHKFERTALKMTVPRVRPLGLFCQGIFSAQVKLYKILENRAFLAIYNLNFHFDVVQYLKMVRLATAVKRKRYRHPSVTAVDLQHD